MAARVLFHLVERKFYLFGLVLWPQDVLPGAAADYFCHALFLFTAIAGRLFCGYACPQTVHRNLHVGREQDRGDRSARMKPRQGR